MHGGNIVLSSAPVGRWEGRGSVDAEIRIAVAWVSRVCRKRLPALDYLINGFDPFKTLRIGHCGSSGFQKTRIEGEQQNKDELGDPADGRGRPSRNIKRQVCPQDQRGMPRSGIERGGFKGSVLSIRSWNEPGLWRFGLLRKEWQLRIDDL